MAELVVRSVAIDSVTLGSTATFPVLVSMSPRSHRHAMRGRRRPSRHSRAVEEAQDMVGDHVYRFSPPP
jgi:hypothetical protein